MLKSFRELEVWQKAHVLALEIYRVTAAFPDHERFGVVSQLGRAAASIPANIAEGFGRRSSKEFLQCLGIANGSLEETRYFLILSRDLRYLSDIELRSLESICNSVGPMLGALSRSIREKASLSLASTHRPPLGDRKARAADRGTRVAIPAPSQNSERQN